MLYEVNENQKHRRYKVCYVPLLSNTTDLFLDCIVTCDENELNPGPRRSIRTLPQTKKDMVTV